MILPRLIVILIAFLIDLLFGDPPNRFHPLLLIGGWFRVGYRIFTTRRAIARFWFGAVWTLLGALLFAGPLWKITDSKYPMGTMLQTANSRITRHSSSLFAFLSSPLRYRATRVPTCRVT